MYSFFALAPLKDYLFDVVVCTIIGAILLVTFLAAIKRTTLFVTIFGLLLLVSSLPIAVASELSISGCCGAPSTGREGLGFAIGSGVAILGIVTIILGKRLAKRRKIN